MAKEMRLSSGFGSIFSVLLTGLESGKLSVVDADAIVDYGPQQHSLTNGVLGRDKPARIWMYRLHSKWNKVKQ